MQMNTQSSDTYPKAEQAQIRLIRQVSGDLKCLINMQMFKKMNHIRLMDGAKWENTFLLQAAPDL